MPSIPVSTHQTPPPPPTDRDKRLRQVAVDLEASFLAEMLKQAGLGETRDSFGGGAGEEGFSSFLRQEQSQAMARAGGIGLAEHIFDSLKARNNV